MRKLPCLLVDRLKKKSSLLNQQYTEGQSCRQAEELPLISPTFQLLSISRRQNPNTSPELGTNLRDLPFTATARAMPAPEHWVHCILHRAAAVEKSGVEERRIKTNAACRKALDSWEMCLRLFPSLPFPQNNRISWQHSLSSPGRECMWTHRLLRQQQLSSMEMYTANSSCQGWEACGPFCGGKISAAFCSWWELAMPCVYPLCMKTWDLNHQTWSAVLLSQWYCLLRFLFKACL